MLRTRTSPAWPYVVGLVACTAGCATADSPTTPIDVRITPTSTTSLEITWSAAPAGEQLVGYDVYRDGAFAGTVDGPSAMDSGLRAGSRHCYSVVAVASGGIRSPQSEEACGFTRWNREMIDWSGYGIGQDFWSDVSLALDSANRPHLGYMSTRLGDQSARYTARAQGTWSAPLIFAGGATEFDSTTVAVASDNVATLCFVRSGWMIPTELACQRIGGEQTIVDTGDFNWASLAYDASDVGHISYYDVAAGDLVVATDATGTWVPTRVDTVGNVGSHCALAVTASGTVHVAYHDAAGLLKHATDASGAWVVTTVDADGFVGEYADLALDTAGHVHISYHDATHGDLKYATNVSGAWSVTTIDAEGEVGLFSSVAVDAQGTPHFAYFDASRFDAVYVSRFDGVWDRTVIDDGDTIEAGRYASIVIDTAGVISIAYDAGPRLYVANNR